MTRRRTELSCPSPLAEAVPRIKLAHGGGGRGMQDLLDKVILPGLADPLLDLRHDSSVLEVKGGRLAFTTDGYVVRPRFFPGGDIGKLAVFGTVNDLAMAGAQPAYLSVGMILEEGLAIDEVRRVIESMRAAAMLCGVRLVTGDTKVVDRGKGDGLFLHTSGIGMVPDGVDIRPQRVRPGDAILVSGDLGRHGIAVLSVREGIAFAEPVESDCAPVHEAVAALLRTGIDVHCLRDPTRGGLASALNEIAAASALHCALEESSIPVAPVVAGACELLGLDPLSVACEGRFLAIVPSEEADMALEALRRTEAGVGSVRIGTVEAAPAGVVSLRTVFGTRRPVDLPFGDQLPRIC